MLDRIDEQSDSLKKLAYNCLMWVLHAARPLRMNELRDATAIKEATRCRKDLNLYDADVIIEACANFLIEENSTVRLIHYSVKEYLKVSFHHHHQQLTNALDPGFAHIELAMACVRYLLLDFQKEGPCQTPKELCQITQEYSLCFYASQFFDYHISQLLDIHDSLVDLINKFLSLGNKAIAAVLQIRALSDASNQVQVERDFDKRDYPVDAATILYATRLRDVFWVTRRARWTNSMPSNSPKVTIHEAARNGRVDTIIQLFKQGISVNALDENDAGPLYYACRNGNYSVASILISNGANVNHLSGKLGQDSPLHIASSCGYVSIVRMLLNNGTDPNLEGGLYGTALIAACHAGQIEIVELLFRHNASIESSNYRQLTALNEAILSGKRSIVRLLLRRGVDVNTAGNKKPAIHVAIENGREDIVRDLIEYGANINVSHQKDGTPFHIAVMNGHESITQLLLQKASCGDGAEDQRVACNVALRALPHDYEGVARVLLEYGAEINAIDQHGISPLHVVASKGYTNITRLLLSRGADLKAYGGEALEWAALEGHGNTVSLLLQSSVDANKGKALEWACYKGCREVVVLLLNHGIDILLHGPECLELAVTFDHRSILEVLIVRILQERGAKGD